LYPYDAIKDSTLSHLVPYSNGFPLYNLETSALDTPIIFAKTPSVLAGFLLYGFQR
jgi:hypothetical protein